MLPEWPREPGSRVIRAASASAWKDAQALLVAAELELADAQEYCRVLAEDAWQRGYEKGQCEGREEAARLLVHTRQHLDQRLKELPSQLTALVVDVLKQWLNEGSDTARVKRLVLAGLRHWPANQPLTLWVAPEHACELAAERWAGAQITVCADASLGPTQALLVGYDQSVDLSPDHQLTTLEPYLKDRIATWLEQGQHHG